MARVMQSISTYGRGTAPKPKSKPKAKPAAKPKSKDGSSSSSIDKYQKEAEKRQREAENRNTRDAALADLDRINADIRSKRAQRLVNSGNLDAQKILTGGGLRNARDINLGNISRNLSTKMGQIRRTFDTSMKDFQTNLRDNEKAEGDASFANLVNRARERGDLQSQALSQGAGESDILKTQLQSLRNWSANQADVTRSFYDTRTSVNSAITDLNNGTRTSMINEEQSANAQRADTWNDYFGAMSDSYATQANLSDQNYLLREDITSLKDSRRRPNSVLDWIDDGKDYEDWEPQEYGSLGDPADPTRNPSSRYATKASEWASKAYEDPGVSSATLNWKGGAQSTTGLNGSNRAAAPTTTLSKKRPEGATLRKW